MSLPELSGSHPIQPGRPQAHGRLGVEIRLTGFHATLWLTAMAVAAGSTLALLSPAQFSSVPLATVIWPIAAGFVVDLLALAMAMPKARWLRGGSLARRPSPWPLALVGWPAFPLYLWLWLRDRRHRPDERSAGPEVEAAFEQLTALPARAAVALGLTLGPSMAVSAILMVQQLGLPSGDAPSWVLLAACASLPFVAVSYSRTHALLRPELLSAPRDSTRRLHRRRDLRIRLLLPASLACIGAVATPLVTTFMWQRAHMRTEALSAAETVAETIMLGEGRAADEALGRFLADHPEVTIRQGARSYGPERMTMPEASGPIDEDLDGIPEAYAWVRGQDIAVVPVGTVESEGPELLALAAITIIAVGLLCIWLIAQGVREDVLRATRQVRRVARGLVPDPLHVDSFNSLELRDLVRAVDRLVARIAEANVAKYVVIEKAQEADRLRSQFLANMSHDLRSPLNSVLGFSELLLTGIEGDITPSQADMCRVIQSSGRFLLQQIDDILDTAKIDAGRMELHAEPSPPATLISRALRRARERLDPEISVETQINAGLPPTFSDPHRATQAIENVLVFAAERVPKGGVLTIEASVEQGGPHRGRRILVDILTPNPPATMEQLDQVLEGFYRIPGHRGLGLSLPLAGSVLELHGGSLDITEDDTHMRFSMRFPVPERRKRLQLKSGRRIVPPPSTRWDSHPPSASRDRVEVAEPPGDDDSSPRSGG